VFLGLCVLCVLHAAYFYSQLPDKVASHFGAGGKPDAWSSKTSFMYLYLGIVGGSALLFVGIAFAMCHIPPSMINLPHKDYWLVPERRQETLDSLFQWLLWFGSATVVFFLEMMDQSFRVHVGKADCLQHPGLSVGVYVGFTVLWTIGLLVRFGIKPRSVRKR